MTGCDWCFGSGCFRCEGGGLLNRELTAQYERENALSFLQEHFGRPGRNGATEIRAPASLEDLIALTILAIGHGARQARQDDGWEPYDPMTRFGMLEMTETS